MGRHLLAPRLERLAIVVRSGEGEEVAARLARSFVSGEDVAVCCRFDEERHVGWPLYFR